MKRSPLLWLRFAVVGSGALAGILLVRALASGLASLPVPLPLGVDHLVGGILVAATVMPGPLLGFVVTPASSEKARGLAVGGSAVTALAALLAGALTWRSLFVTHAAGFTEVLGFAWAVLALPLAGVDYLRLRRGGGGERGGSDSGG